MEKRKRLTKETLIGFRVTKAEARSIDILAELTGTNRSVVLRRFVPDLKETRSLDKAGNNV